MREIKNIFSSIYCVIKIKPSYLIVKIFSIITSVITALIPVMVVKEIVNLYYENQNIGKIAVLGIIPMLAILYIFLNAGGGLFGTIILLVVVIIQIVMLIKNKNHEGIADKIANVYPVNFTETVIYKTQKELDEAYYNYNK